MSLPPSAKGARRRDPEPSEPHGPGPQAKTCSSSCLSWLHPLRSWSLRQTRGGLIRASHGRSLLERYRASFSSYSETALTASCFVYALLTRPDARVQAEVADEF